MTGLREGGSSTQPTARHWVLVTTFLLAFYLVIPNARPDFGRFNAHDSESYLALSHSLVHGRGYTRSLDNRYYVPHTVWAPGLPVLMMPAVWLSGELIDWRLVKSHVSVVVLAGAVAAGVLVSRSTGSSQLGLWTLLALGLSPYFWYFAHRVMIEGPLIAGVFCALLLGDRVWARRSPSLVEASLSGLVAGSVMLIRGHALGLVLLPFAYWYGTRASRATRPRLLVLSVSYVCAFVVPYTVWSIRCAQIPARDYDSMRQSALLFKVDPNNPDSRWKTPAENTSLVLTNLRTHAVYNVVQQVIPGLWADELWSWKGSGVVALCLSAGLVALTFRGLPHMAGLFAAASAIFMLNSIYSFGGSPRFWFPYSCSMIVLIVAGTGRLQTVAVSSKLGAVIVVGLFANLCVFVVDHERDPFFSSPEWRPLAELMEDLRRTPVASEGVLAGANHLAFELTTGIPAPLVHPEVRARVDHVLLAKSERTTCDRSGWQLVRQNGPWQLFRLPRVELALEIHGRCWSRTRR
jgi:hypothetical protein